MSIVITSNEYSSVKQSIRKLYVKIDLLNFNFQVVDSIEGSVQSGKVDIDSNSDIRRTCNISIVDYLNTFEITSGGRIWIDKYIQIYLGTELNNTQEIVYTNMGIYIINNPEHVYDITTDTINFEGLDLMAKLTGARNGYIPYVSSSFIPQGSVIRDVIISLLELGGFNKYVLEDNGYVTTYDINLDVGATIYEALVALRDIYPNREMFFDINGVFHYQRIPNGASDPVLVTNDIWDWTVTGLTNNISFEEVKNSIEVWGYTLTPAYSFGEAIISGSSYIVSGSEPEYLSDNTMIGFYAPSIIVNPYLKVNEFNALPIKTEDGSAFAIIPEANNYYIVTTSNEETLFTFNGYQQIYASSEDENPDSPYYVGSIGVINLPLYGGEYDNIMTNKLAKDRANYELYLRARMNDSVTLNSTIIPWLDVNIKVSYTNSIEQKIDGIFFIKNISMDLSVNGTMNIEMIKWYDYDASDNI